MRLNHQKIIILVEKKHIKYGLSRKEDILTPRGPQIRESDVTYPHFNLSHGTYLAFKPLSFQLNEKLSYLKNLMYTNSGF